jgi:signal transduction histidine kinase
VPSRRLYRSAVLASLWRTWRPPTADLVVAGGFVLLGQLITWWQLENPEAFEGPRATNAVLNLLLMAAIAWRRRAPLAAVSWAVAVYFLPHAVVPHDISFLAGAVPLIVLTASAGYFCTRRRAILALALAMLALITITLATPGLRSADAFVINSVFVFLPWLAARGLRAREKHAAALATELASARLTQEAALLEAAAAERAHIARELHDIVAHSVSMMVIQIGAARMQLRSAAGEANAPLLEAEQAGRQTLQDLRRLLGVLRPDDVADGSTDGPPPPQPGLAQLDALVVPLRATGLRVEVAVVGEPVVLPAALDLTAYRIVQEALTNTLKHSRATCVTVQLRWTSSALLVSVVDDGAPSPAGAGGHGLIGLRERTSLFGGSVTAGPGERGWQLVATLPLPAPVPVQRATTTFAP